VPERKRPPTGRRFVSWCLARRRRALLRACLAASPAPAGSYGNEEDSDDGN
jgi:hypothetical protein